METLEYTRLDKAKLWGEGPWVGEPDKVQFPDPETGLPSLGVRNGGPGMGNWCGYVGVAPGHSLYGQDYQDREGMVDVHGGLTFSGACQDSEEESEGVCHVPAKGESDEVWWFGFDCAHAGDYVPGMVQYGPTFAGEYRTLDYLKGETAKLAQALAKEGL